MNVLPTSLMCSEAVLHDMPIASKVSAAFAAAPQLPGRKRPAPPLRAISAARDTGGLGLAAATLVAPDPADVWRSFDERLRVPERVPERLPERLRERELDVDALIVRSGRCAAQKFCCRCAAELSLE